MRIHLIRYMTLGLGLNCWAWLSHVKGDVVSVWDVYVVSCCDVCDGDIRTESYYDCVMNVAAYCGYTHTRNVPRTDASIAHVYHNVLYHIF